MGVAQVQVGRLMIVVTCCWGFRVVLGRAVVRVVGVVRVVRVVRMRSVANVATMVKVRGGSEDAV